MDKIISSLIDLIIEHKKFKFLTSEGDFDKILFEKNILKLEKDKISISDYPSISSLFLKRYKEKLDFKINAEFSKNENFIKRIKDDFTSNGYVPDYHRLEKEIWKSIIKESNYKYECTFNSYLNSIDLNNKPNSIFKFIEAYSNVLHTLNLSVGQIFENTLLLTEITKSDARYNYNLGEVMNGIRNKCKADYELGLELLNKSLSLNDDKANIISTIVSGLYDLKRIEFYNSILDELIVKDKKINFIFFGLSNISEVENSDCELFIRLINNYNRKDSLIISRLSLIFSILKSSNTKYHEFCFKELISAIENEKTAFFILNNLAQLNNYDQEKTEIIVKLINQDFFSIKKHIDSISNVLEKFEPFKKVVLSVVQNKPFENFAKNFQSYFHSFDKIKLDKFTIDLLTDNQASKRNIGIDIFKQLSSYGPHQFTFNILELSHLLQYKLWVSLTQDFHEPKDRLVALLPLIDSKSNLIKESFICKLEEISENYGGQVTKVLENYLDKDNPIYISVVERVKIYIEDYCAKNIDIKKSIPELNPYRVHYKFIKKFNKLFYKNMSKTVDKEVRENSFLSVLGSEPVRLSKGGGWSSGSNKEISPLGKVETSFSMSRNYFINPNEYELEIGFLTRQDWTDKEFLGIKTSLENEQ